MRALLLLVLCSCGRIAFDATDDGGTGDGRTGDAAGDGANVSQHAYLVSSVQGQVSDLFSVDLNTGVLTTLGTIPASFDEVDGIAAWDSNTLYAVTYTGNLLRITLSPFNVTMVAFAFGSLTALERTGNSLLSIDDVSDVIVTIDPTIPTITSAQPVIENLLPVDLNGGDVAPLSGSQWLYWSNTTPPKLWEIDASSGKATLRATPASAAHVSGLAMLGSTLFGVSGDSDAVFTIDPASAALGPLVKVCSACPTTYDVRFGDMSPAP